eukprot:maker-scaffold1592_size34625-snap-gene-0.5 protein:Tk01212 transcript:maker-scaffold1592_size34625-snap-gene-0.5-mRNA-1 annotation:"PREDICTED: bestrophin-1-like"
MADSQYTPEPKVPEMGAFPMTKTNIYANRYKDTNKRFRGFWHLMAMWKGSVLKLIWHDMLVFLVLYSALSLTYRFWLFDNPKHRQAFELVCVYASRFRGMIPITFLTGFYVSQVVSRYWDQFMTLPFTDQLAYKVVTFIPGDDVYKRNLRRTVMRYVNLSIVLVYRLVSSKVRDRFSTFDELVRSRLLLPEEKDRLQQADKETPFELTWVPILWALRLIQDARTKGRINIEPPIFASLVGQFDKIDTSNRKILNYGWVNFPLAYTQVATISVFAYFFASLFACQYLIPESKTMDTETFPNLNISFSVSKPFELHTPDIFVPVFTIVEFISYMGWIKVAEALLNPFGDDDDDFQINYLIDRNLFISYMIVDQGGYDFPDVKDPFLADNVPPELPYNDDSLMDDSSKLITTTVEDQVEPVETGIIGRVRRKLSTASFARIAPGNRSTSSHSTMSVHSNLGPGSSAEPKLSRANSGAVVDHDQDIEIGALGSNNHLQVPRKSVRRKSAPKPDMEVMADAQDDMNSVSKFLLIFNLAILGASTSTIEILDHSDDAQIVTKKVGEALTLTCIGSEKWDYCQWKHNNRTCSRTWSMDNSFCDVWEDESVTWIGLPEVDQACSVDISELSNAHQGAWSCHLIAANDVIHQAIAHFDVQTLAPAQVSFHVRPPWQMEAGQSYEVKCSAKNGNPVPRLVAQVGPQMEPADTDQILAQKQSKATNMAVFELIPDMQFQKLYVKCMAEQIDEMGVNVFEPSIVDHLFDVVYPPQTLEGEQLEIVFDPLKEVEAMVTFKAYPVPTDEEVIWHIVQGESSSKLKSGERVDGFRAKALEISDGYIIAQLEIQPLGEELALTHIYLEARNKVGKEEYHLHLLSNQRAATEEKPPQEMNSHAAPIIIWSVVGSVVILMAIVILLCFMRHKKLLCFKQGPVTKYFSVEQRDNETTNPHVQTLLQSSAQESMKNPLDSSPPNDVDESVTWIGLPEVDQACSVDISELSNAHQGAWSCHLIAANDVIHQAIAHFDVQTLAPAQVSFHVRPPWQMEAGQSYEVKCSAKNGNPVPRLVAQVGPQMEPADTDQILAQKQSKATNMAVFELIPDMQFQKLYVKCMAEQIDEMGVNVFEPSIVDHLFDVVYPPQTLEGEQLEIVFDPLKEVEAMVTFKAYPVPTDEEVIWHIVQGESSSKLKSGERVDGFRAKALEISDGYIIAQLEIQPLGEELALTHIYLEARNKVGKEEYHLHLLSNQRAATEEKPPQEMNSHAAPIIIWSVVGSVVILMAIVILLCFMRHKKLLCFKQGPVTKYFSVEQRDNETTNPHVQTLLQSSAQE